MSSASDVAWNISVKRMSFTASIHFRLVSVSVFVTIRFLLKKDEHVVFLILFIFYFLGAPFSCIQFGATYQRDGGNTYFTQR